MRHNARQSDNNVHLKSSMKNRREKRPVKITHFLPSRSLRLLPNQTDFTMKQTASFVGKNLLSTEWIRFNFHRKKVTEARVVSVSPSSGVNPIGGFSFNLAPETLTKSMNVNASLSTNQSIHMFTLPIFHQRLSSSAAFTIYA